MSEYFESFLSATDNRKMFGTLLTAFECLSHDLLTAKLNAYGFSIAALKLVQNCLSNRKQRTKINSDFSSCEEIVFGVPQGSMLGPSLFNIFLCDLFFIMRLILQAKQTITHLMLWVKI